MATIHHVLAALLCARLVTSTLVDNVDEPTPDVTNRYIVTLKSQSPLEKHIAWVQSLVIEVANSSNPNASGPTEEHDSISHVYHFSTYKAYAGQFDASVVRSIRRNPEVESVQPDQIWSISMLAVQHEATYGLNLISHRKLGQAHKGYLYDSSAGNGSFAYVLDTGIDIRHPDLDGRAFFGYNSVKASNSDWDHVGHGTHVAGIIGGKTFGVAKQCELISVKVFAGFTGTMSEVLAGYDWAVNHILVRKRARKSVINLSLGGSVDVSFNKAIDTAHGLGVVTVVSAGNANQDVKSSSPASAAGAIAVGATDWDRVRANYSNWGAGIALFAPGTSIVSSWPWGSHGANATLSGTSMAAPFVSGVVAYLQGIRTFRNAHSVRKGLSHLATRDVVGEAKDSPNLFLYNGGGSRLV